MCACEEDIDGVLGKCVAAWMGAGECGRLRCGVREETVDQAVTQIMGSFEVEKK